MKKFTILLQHHQFHRQDVNMLSVFIQTAPNVQPPIWNVLSVNQHNTTVTMVWPTMNVFTDATGQINFFTFAIQKLSLVLNAQPKLSLVHNRPVSGHTHDMPSPVTNTIWSLALMGILVWFLAVKVHFSTNTLWLAKNLRNNSNLYSCCNHFFLHFFDASV